MTETIIDDLDPDPDERSSSATPRFRRLLVIGGLDTRPATFRRLDVAAIAARTALGGEASIITAAVAPEPLRNPTEFQVSGPQMLPPAA